MDPHTPVQPVSFNNDGGRFAIQTAVYQNHGQTIVNQTSAAELERLPYAVEAPFNAYVKQHEPFCLPGTRTALLEQIYSWADTYDERCVYWLSGLAGTGKSTIARTVARRLNDKSRLGASFFFSKGGGDVSHAGKFVTSIVVQLASHFPGVRQQICEVVKNIFNISSLSLRDQWRHLVLQPLLSLDSTNNATSVVLVIDALDECDDNDNIGKIIELLAEAQQLGGLRLRIFLTSRPEVPIRHGFDHMSSTLLQRYVLHRISPDIVDADIALFLEQKFRTISRQQSLPASWPGPEMVAKMTQRASGLFIWAATAHRFIQQGGRFAVQRLDSIMEQNGNGPLEPEKHLDNIYFTVLRDSLSPNYTPEEKEEHCKMLRLVLGTLSVLRWPLSMKTLSGLLDVMNDSISRTVQDLHAILDIPEDEDGKLRFHHPSLRDFLLDCSRCTDAEFCVDEAQAHGALALQCIELMIRFFQQGQELHEGCLELQYACLSWDMHLLKSENELINNARLRVFLEEYADKWGITVPHQFAEQVRHRNHWMGLYGHGLTPQSASPQISWREGVIDLRHFDVLTG